MPLLTHTPEGTIYAQGKPWIRIAPVGDTTLIERDQAVELICKLLEAMKALAQLTPEGRAEVRDACMDLANQWGA